VGEFLRVLLDSIAYLWPFRLVQQWEQGAYYLCGRYWREVGPGVPWPVVPWFMEVRTVSIAAAPVGTPRIDITLKDGRQLSCAATVVCRVIDFHLAVNTVDDYRESTQELIASVLAEKLVEVEPSRLESGARGRLLTDLQKWVGAELAKYGIEVSRLSFTSFVLAPRTYRLLTDPGTVANW
jgi:regulator of protease activity HflC (stomatin/prohibitin superfamily)